MLIFFFLFKIGISTDWKMMDGENGKKLNPKNL